MAERIEEDEEPIEPTVRFRSAQWCKKCEKEISHYSSTCQVCGGTHMGGVLCPFAVVRQEWIVETIIWHKPSTWSGGRWGNTTLHSER